MKCIIMLALLGATVLCDSVANATGERLAVSIVNYSGKSDDIRIFRSLLNDWVLTLPEEIPSKVGSEYLRHLRTLERTTEFRSAIEIDEYWKHSDAIQIIYGVIEAEGSNAYFVRSKIYLGDLQGSFPHKTLLIELPFAVRNYADTQDFHTAALLYSLAMDAQRVNPNQTSLIAQLLKSAKDKLTDIKKRKTLAVRADSPLADMETAIDEAAKRLRGHQ